MSETSGTCHLCGCRYKRGSLLVTLEFLHERVGDLIRRDVHESCWANFKIAIPEYTSEFLEAFFVTPGSLIRERKS